MNTIETGAQRHRWTLSWLLHDLSGKVRIGWKLLGFCALIPALGIGQDWTLRSLNHGIYPSLPFKLGDLVVVLLPTWLFLRLEKRPLASLGLRLNLRWFRDLGLGFLMACALMLFASVGVAFTQGGWIRTSLGAGVLVQGLSICMGVAMFEELLFRGYPFQRMLETWGVLTTQILMAAFFVLPHVVVGSLRGYPAASLLGAAVNIGCAAIFLGFALLRTGSLGLPIGIHAGWNWMQGTMLGLGVSGGTPPSFLTPTRPGPEVSWITGGFYGPEAGIPGILAVLIGIAIIGCLFSSSCYEKPVDVDLTPTPLGAGDQ